jgi:hypothetical protein
MQFLIVVSMFVNMHHGSWCSCQRNKTPDRLLLSNLNKVEIGFRRLFAG